MFSQKLQVAVADLVLSAVDSKREIIGSKPAQTLEDLEAKSKEFRYQDAESQVRIFFFIFILLADGFTRKNLRRHNSIYNVLLLTRFRFVQYCLHNSPPLWRCTFS